jgi:hypothetical protein
MAPRLTVISWRDIPAQVVARDGRRAAKAVLPLRFQVAVDRAATRTGLKGMDDYLGEWRRTERDCGPDLEAEVAAEVARIEAELNKPRLAALVAAGGRLDGPAVPDGTSPAPADPPAPDPTEAP